MTMNHLKSLALFLIIFSILESNFCDPVSNNSSTAHEKLQGEPFIIHQPTNGSAHYSLRNHNGQDKNASDVILKDAIIELLDENDIYMKNRKREMELVPRCPKLNIIHITDLPFPWKELIISGAMSQCLPGQKNVTLPISNLSKPLIQAELDTNAQVKVLTKNTQSHDSVNEFSDQRKDNLKTSSSSNHTYLNDTFYSKNISEDHYKRENQRKDKAKQLHNVTSISASRNDSSSSKVEKPISNVEIQNKTIKGSNIKETTPSKEAMSFYGNGTTMLGIKGSLSCFEDSNISLNSTLMTSISNVMDQMLRSIAVQGGPNRTLAIVFTGNQGPESSLFSKCNLVDSKDSYRLYKGILSERERSMKYLNSLVASFLKRLSKNICNNSSYSPVIIPSIGKLNIWDPCHSNKSNTSSLLSSGSIDELKSCLPEGPNPTLKYIFELWKDWIPLDQKETFLQGGYYVRDMDIRHLPLMTSFFEKGKTMKNFTPEYNFTKVRLISLNTIYFTQSNTLTADCQCPNSPGKKELDWLEKVLQEAKISGWPTYIIGSDRPSQENYKPHCYNQYMKLLKKFSNETDLENLEQEETEKREKILRSLITLLSESNTGEEENNQISLRKNKKLVNFMEEQLKNYSRFGDDGMLFGQLYANRIQNRNDSMGEEMNAVWKDNIDSFREVPKTKNITIDFVPKNKDVASVKIIQFRPLFFSWDDLRMNQYNLLRSQILATDFYSRNDGHNIIKNETKVTQRPALACQQRYDQSILERSNMKTVQTEKQPRKSKNEGKRQHRKRDSKQKDVIIMDTVFKDVLSTYGLDNDDKYQFLQKEDRLLKMNKIKNEAEKKMMKKSDILHNGDSGSNGWHQISSDERGYLEQLILTYLQKKKSEKKNTTEFNSATRDFVDSLERSSPRSYEKGQMPRQKKDLLIFESRRVPVPILIDLKKEKAHIFEESVMDGSDVRRQKDTMSFTTSNQLSMKEQSKPAVLANSAKRSSSSFNSFEDGEKQRSRKMGSILQLADLDLGGDW